MISWNILQGHLPSWLQGSGNFVVATIVEVAALYGNLVSAPAVLKQKEMNAADHGNGERPLRSGLPTTFQ